MPVTPLSSRSLEQFEEDEWYGRQVFIGSAVLRVIGPVARVACGQVVTASSAEPVGFD